MLGLQTGLDALPTAGALGEELNAVLTAESYLAASPEVIMPREVPYALPTAGAPGTQPDALPANGAGECPTLHAAGTRPLPWSPHRRTQVKCGREKAAPAKRLSNIAGTMGTPMDQECPSKRLVGEQASLRHDGGCHRMVLYLA